MRCLRIHLGGSFLAIWLAWSVSASANELTAALNAINAPDIKIHIDVLADDAFEGREAGSQGGRAAGGYLEQQFQRYGLKPAGDRGTYFQQFRGNCRNILGILAGGDEDLKQQYVLIGAHYDHVGYGNRKTSFGPFGYVHNGADDNASGVAGLLEVIEGFQALGTPPRRSILFALWDGEEQGLWGSKHWTDSPTVPLDHVVFALNADMIGHLRERTVMIYGTRTATGLRQLVSGCNTLTDLVLDFTWELKANSDHYTFFTRGIPVLMVHTGLNEYYHRPIDDAHLINHDGSQEVARLLFTVALELANERRLAGFRPQAGRDGPTELAALERPAPPRPPRLGVTLRRDTDTRPGVYLQQVFSDLPADRAGLKTGDRVVRFAGQEIAEIEPLLLEILAAPSPAQLVVERETGGMVETLDITVSLEGSPLRLGISYREDEGEPGTVVLSEVVTGSPADRAGLRVADRIYRVGDQRFADGGQFLELVATIAGPCKLLVERQGRLLPVTIDVPGPEI